MSLRLIAAAAAALLAGGAAMAQQAAPAKPLDASWLTRLDYPAASLRNEEQGTVAFELAIDVLGRVTDCRITGSSGFSTLDRQTCTVAHRARFAPAHDANGRAVAGTYASRIRWVLPKIEPMPVANWLSIGTMHLAADTTMLDCQPEDIGPVPDKVGNPCRAFRAGRPHLLLGMMGGKGGPQTLVTELAMAFEGLPPPAMRYRTPGHRIAARAQISFEVSESGAVENCRRVPTGEESILERMPTACAYGLGPFIAPTDAAGRPMRARGTYTMAISVAE